MTKKVLFALYLSMYAVSLLAQNEQQEINAIKSNMNFLYATGTSTTSGEEASNNAKDLLALEIEQWLKENATEDLAGYIAKSRESLSQINTKRGNLYRVFAFVKKKDILPYFKEEDVMVVDFVEPKAMGQQDSINTNSNTVNNKSLESHKDLSMHTGNGINQLTTKEKVHTYIPTSKEQLMLKITSFAELNEYINSGRKNKSIDEIGKYSNMPHAGLVYVFIHNKEGKIPACLKVNEGNVINLASGQKDLINNYKGCGAIWVKFKNEQ